MVDGFWYLLSRGCGLVSLGARNCSRSVSKSSHRQLISLSLDHIRLRRYSDNEIDTCASRRAGGVVHVLGPGFNRHGFYTGCVFRAQFYAGWSIRARS